jgi:hypothetical protein
MPLFPLTLHFRHHSASFIPVSISVNFLFSPKIQKNFRVHLTIFWKPSCAKITALFQEIMKIPDKDTLTDFLKQRQRFKFQLCLLNQKLIHFGNLFEN